MMTIQINPNDMSPRDYFAMVALSKLAEPINNATDYKRIARQCYTLADAMIEERGEE